MAPYDANGEWRAPTKAELAASSAAFHAKAAQKQHEEYVSLLAEMKYNYKRETGGSIPAHYEKAMADAIARKDYDAFHKAKKAFGKNLSLDRETNPRSENDLSANYNDAREARADARDNVEELTRSHESAVRSLADAKRAVSNSGAGPDREWLQKDVQRLENDVVPQREAALAKAKTEFAAREKTFQAARSALETFRATGKLPTPTGAQPAPEKAAVPEKSAAPVSPGGKAKKILVDRQKGEDAKQQAQLAKLGKTKKGAERELKTGAKGGQYYELPSGHRIYVKGGK